MSDTTFEADVITAPAGLTVFDAEIHQSVLMLGAEEARQIVKNINGRFEQSRKDLLELHDREGWRALGYENWRDCVQAEFQQSAAYLYRQLSAAKIEQLIESPIGEIPESHLRPLAKMNTQTVIKRALDRADQLAGDSPRTAKHIKQAAKEIAEPALPSEDAQHVETIKAILKEADDKGERTGTRLYQQAYDHAREIHDLALHNKMIALIDRATDAPEPPPPISAPVGDPLPPKLIAMALSDLDATLPTVLQNAGYYWQSAIPPIIAHNDGWRGDAPTVALALEAASDREKARGTPHMIALPPFPATDLPALMAAITQLVKVVNAWSPDAQRKVAPAIGMIKAIGRKALEATS